MGKLADIFRQDVRESDAECAAVPPSKSAAAVTGKSAIGEKLTNSKPGGNFNLRSAGAEHGARMDATKEASLSVDRNAMGTANVIGRSNVADRVGERTESLQHLVSDTRRKIVALDAIKQAFDEIILPFNDAMQALDQERLTAKNLSTQLDEKIASQERLRDELHSATGKAQLLELEANNLRSALEKARDALQQQARTRTELAEQIAGRDERISDLEQQVEQGNAQRRSLGEGVRAMQEQILRGEQRIGELQQELSAAAEKMVHLKEDNRELRYSGDQSKQEIARLHRRLDESENVVTAVRGELSTVSANYAAAREERDRLAATLRDLKERRQTEQHSLGERVEALQARATAAERLLAETRQRLITRTEEARAFVCKAAEAAIARNTAERRLAEFEALQGWRGGPPADPNESRTALSEYLKALNVKSREMAAAGAAEKLAAITERNEHLEAQTRAMRISIESRPLDMNTLLQPDGLNRSEVDGALEAARRDNARLEEEIASLRSALRSEGFSAAAKVATETVPNIKPEKPVADENEYAAVTVELGQVQEQSERDPECRPSIQIQQDQQGAKSNGGEQQYQSRHPVDADPLSGQVAGAAHAVVAHETFSLFRFRRSADEDDEGRKSSAA